MEVQFYMRCPDITSNRSVTLSANNKNRPTRHFPVCLRSDTPTRRVGALHQRQGRASRRDLNRKLPLEEGASLTLFTRGAMIVERDQVMSAKTKQN